MMNTITGIMKILDRKSEGNPDFLNQIYKSAMKQIRKSCASDQEYEEKCAKFLDAACEAAGEDHREFYREYMRKMNPENH